LHIGTTAAAAILASFIFSNFMWPRQLLHVLALRAGSVRVEVL
jgi:hypothetical protein